MFFLSVICRATGFLAIAFLTSPSEAGTLYATEFEEFTAGNNRWAGTGGWVSNNTTGGAQGILQDPVADLPLGRTAYLGFHTPSSAFTTVYRPINFNPATTGHHRIEFESLLGLQDSTNSRRDRFYLSCYNISGDFLAAVVFDNTTGKMLSDDGVTVRDSGVAFLKGDALLGLAALQILRIGIDLDLNRWTASLDSIPLFDQTFTATNKTRTLGTMAVEWEIASGSPGTAGNNWLLVADWLVASIPPGPFSVLSIARNATGQATLTWPGHPGFDYQVQHSSGLGSWSNALAGSRFSANSTQATLSFTDPSTTIPPRRFYRVVRTPTP